MIELLKCMIKKSVDTFKKLVLYASYVIVGITGIVVAGFVAWKGLEVASPVVLAVSSILVSIPWYWYVGVAVILAIPVYSVLWCVARELTDEDWKSDTAQSIAGASTVAGVVVGVVVVVRVVAVAGVVVVVRGVAVASVVAVAVASVNSKTFLFPGAYLHYRKRMRKLQQGGELK